MCFQGRFQGRRDSSEDRARAKRATMNPLTASSSLNSYTSGHYHGTMPLSALRIRCEKAFLVQLGLAIFLLRVFL